MKHTAKIAAALAALVLMLNPVSIQAAQPVQTKRILHHTTQTTLPEEQTDSTREVARKAVDTIGQILEILPAGEH